MLSSFSIGRKKIDGAGWGRVIGASERAQTRELEEEFRWSPAQGYRPGADQPEH